MIEVEAEVAEEEVEDVEVLILQHREVAIIEVEMLHITKLQEEEDVVVQEVEEEVVVVVSTQPKRLIRQPIMLKINSMLCLEGQLMDKRNNLKMMLSLMTTQLSSKMMP